MAFQPLRQAFNRIGIRTTGTGPMGVVWNAWIQRDGLRYTWKRNGTEVADPVPVRGDTTMPSGLIATLKNVGGARGKIIAGLNSENAAQFTDELDPDAVGPEHLLSIGYLTEQDLYTFNAGHRDAENTGRVDETNDFHLQYTPNATPVDPAVPTTDPLPEPGEDPVDPGSPANPGKKPGLFGLGILPFNRLKNPLAQQNLRARFNMDALGMGRPAPGPSVKEGAWDPGDEVTPPTVGMPPEETPDRRWRS